MNESHPSQNDCVYVLRFTVTPEAVVRDFLFKIHLNVMEIDCDPGLSMALCVRMCRYAQEFLLVHRRLCVCACVYGAGAARLEAT